MFHVKIDDRQVLEFTRKSPQRANWALKEAFAMAGGHYRKWLQSFIERGGEGWKPLRDISRRLNRPRNAPLYGLGRLTRFRVSKIQKRYYMLRIGFLFVRGRGQTVAQYRKFKERFKRTYGMTIQALARIHEYGRKQRVTRSMRGAMARHGKPLQKTTRFLETPDRPMAGILYRKKTREIGRYIETRFFRKFFSKEKPKIGF